VSGESFNDGGTWSSTGDKLTVIEPDETSIYTFEISGSTLTLSLSETETSNSYAFDISVTYEKQ